MGQARHHENIRRHRGVDSKGKTKGFFIAALVGLALAPAALGSGPVPLSPSTARQAAPSDLTFDKSAAWKMLLDQCAFGPRVPMTKAHEECQKYIYDSFKASCDVAELQPFDHHWSITNSTVSMNNVIAYQNWDKAKVRVLLMAHWDSRPFADQDPNPANRNTPILGADDGASGVAVLMELAKELKGKLGDVGIVYVLTDGEDLGPDIGEMLLGAVKYINDLKSPKPDYGILLDMIGNKGVRVPIEVNSYSAAGPLCRGFYAYAKVLGLDATFPDEMGDTIEDDHLPLIKAGIPTMDLIDFNYPSWHTLADTPDKCSPEALGAVGKMLKGWLLKSPSFKMPAATQ